VRAPRGVKNAEDQNCLQQDTRTDRVPMNGSESRAACNSFGRDLKS